MPHVLFMRRRSRACSLADCVSCPHPHPLNPQPLPSNCHLSLCSVNVQPAYFLILWWIQFVACNVVKTAHSRRKGQEPPMLSHSNYSNLSKNTDYRGSLTIKHQRGRQRKTKSKTDRREVGVMGAAQQGVQTAELKVEKKLYC